MDNEDLESRRRGIRLEDLAQMADVSIATVSRALNDSPLVRDDTKRKIWKLAREHQYPFRPQMPAMLSGASTVIGVVIPTPYGKRTSLADPFFLELIGGIGEAAQEIGCDIVLSHVAPKSLEDLSALIQSSRTEGVIFLGQSILHDRYNQLSEIEKRFVVWGAELPGQRYCSVGGDNIRGGMRATNHLLRLGRKRIAFFGDIEAPEIMQRYHGYTKALEAAGISVDLNLVAPVHFDVESAENGVEGLLAKGVKFDAIFGANDLVALGAIRGLERHNVHVPKDVSVVGYDDIYFAKYTQPALTTISQDLQKAGRLLVSKLMHSTNGQEIRSERLPTELYVRESCGA